jgi:hypothetical protein
VRYRSTRIVRVLAGQSHYPDYLLRIEGRRRSGTRLVGEHLFDHLRDEDTITIFFFVRCFLLRFLLGGHQTRRGLEPALTPGSHLPTRSVPKSWAIRVLLAPEAPWRTIRTRRTSSVEEFSGGAQGAAGSLVEQV